MKKLFSILLLLTLLLGLILPLSGCDKPTISVRSELDIDEDFSGTRTVTVVYPLSTDIDAIKDDVIAADPAADVKGAQFRYIGVEGDGYWFELKLTFSDKEQYEDTVGALIGRNADVFLSRKDTYLTQGTRMAEDFDVSELIAWIVGKTASCDATRDLGFVYDTNTVKIGSDTFETGSAVSINECEGSPINAITVKTANNKEGAYDRTFTFSVPNSTYIKDKDAIEQYFLTNTATDASYSGWSAEGSNMIYTVIFEALDIDTLTQATAMLLDTDSVEIFYGDRDNASTPLSEGLVFEEDLDTFSFIGTQSDFPTLRYSYSLPLNTTYGEGTVFRNGRWTTAGSWTQGLYTVELDDGSARLRIPDGIQYTVTGVNFGIESLGGGRFRRSTDFLYSKTDGYDGLSYASAFFASKGVQAEVLEDEDNLICHVAFEGTTDEITAQLVRLFGSGNFMAYEKNTGMFSLSVKTEFTDYVNLGYMLNSANMSCPMTYTVASGGGENIVSVSVDGAETAYTERGRSSLPIQGGTATVQYRGNIPITSRIVIYIAAGIALLCLTAFICILLLRPKKRRRTADPLNHPETAYDMPEEAEETEETDAPAPSLTQTTTFSIFELNALARNKKYVDEINKDVEERMHARSIEDQKNDIRARELEEMSRRVYGDDEEKEEEQAAPAEAGEAAAPAENGGETDDDTADSI